MSASQQRICEAGYACSDCARTACVKGVTFAAATGATSCQAISRCGKGQRATTQPEAYRNTVCSSCPSGTYQDASSHLLSSCKAPKDCGPGEVIGVDYTSESDRTCAACNGKTAYQDQSNQSKCKTVSLCGAGEREGTPPSSQADRTCVSCVQGSTFQASTSHANSQCQTVRPVCAPGTYEKAGPTLTSDRVCLPCPAGQYQDVENQDRCKPWRPLCPAGTRESVAESAVRDRVCVACDGKAEYQDQADQSSCKTVKQCGSGEYMTSGPTPTSDRKCQGCTTAGDCTASQYFVAICSGTANSECRACHVTCGSCVAGGADACTSCAGSLVLHSGKCLNSCPVGRYADGNVCKACDSTCYSCDGAGSQACTSCAGARYLYASTRECRTSCPAQYYRVAATNDNRCERCTVCSGGKYSSTLCATAADTVCTAWSTCDVGTAVTQTPSAERDRLCGDCNGVTSYADTTNQASCKAVSDCVAGLYVSVKPSASNNRQCAPCAAGKYTGAPNLALCEECSAGTFAASGSSASCAACGAGKYQDAAGATSCKAIVGGFYGTGGTVQTRTGAAPCEAGFRCAGGSAPRVACNGATEYQDEAQQETCKTVQLCQPGERASQQPLATRDRRCSACPAETFVADENHAIETCAETTKCVAGEYQLQKPSPSSDRRCASCDGVTGYADEGGLLQCKAVTQCKPGERVLVGPTASSDRECGACAADTFSTVANAERCTGVKTCEAGSFVEEEPTPTSDRVCKACVLDSTFQGKPNQDKCEAVALCGPGQRESAAPTLATDRECEACGAGTYQPALQHSASACIAHTVCKAGTYTAKEGSETEDAECEPCATETYQDEPGQMSCKAASRCPAGTREASAPTAAADRTCTPCELGASYMDETEHASKACKAVTVCKAGTFEEVAPTRSADAVCTRCATGSYQDEDDKPSCKALTSCTDTEYISVHHTPLTDQTCTACRVWEDCAANEWLKGVCGGATRDENPTCEACHATCATCSGPGADQCTSCVDSLVLDGTTCTSDCRVGFYVEKQTCKACAGTCHECRGPASDECLQCSGDRFLQPDGQCLETCPEKMWQRILGEDDQVCAPCTVCSGATWSATACQAAADTVCEPWHVCSAGEETRVAPSATSDRQCQSCVQGRDFAAEAGTEECDAVTTCSFPDKEGVAPTVTSDRECTCDLDGCAALVRTVYLDLVCRQPDADELAGGVQACCNGLSEADLEASLRQRSVYSARHSCPGCTVRCGCTAGYIAAPLEGGGNTCEACNGVTEYQPFEGQSRCLNVTVCAVGEQEKVGPSQSADRICEPCPRGYVDADGDGGTKCTACQLHATFSDTRGRTSCLPTTVCGAGHEEDTPATLQSDRTCVTCELGRTWKAAAGRATQCVPVSSCDFPASEWRSSEATLSSDVVCSPLTRCNYTTEFRAADATLRSDTRCQRLTQCDVLRTEFISVTKTDTSDRACAPLTTCAAGEEYELREPTSTTDRICVAYTECRWNQYDIVKATPTSDRACVDVWVATLFSALPTYNASFDGLLRWSQGGGGDAEGRRRALAADATGRATWQAVHDAALQQLSGVLAALGVSADAVVTTAVELVDQHGNVLTAIDDEVASSAAIRVTLRVTDEGVWRAIVGGAAHGLPEASQPGSDWPLIVEPCLPEAYLAGSTLLHSNGSVTVPCVARSRCTLGESWAASRGNTTQDRQCVAVRSCAGGEVRPPTLTSDRACRAAATSSAAQGMVAGLGALGAVLVLLVLVLVLVYHRRQLKRERDRTNASFGGDGKTQISFVNPSFRGMGQDNAQYEGGEASAHPLYDDAAPLGRVMSNPLYAGDMTGEELFEDYDRIADDGDALYDEVHAVDDDLALGSDSDDEGQGAGEYLTVDGAGGATAYGRAGAAAGASRVTPNPAYASPARAPSGGGGQAATYFDVQPVPSGGDQAAATYFDVQPVPSGGGGGARTGRLAAMFAGGEFAEEDFDLAGGGVEDGDGSDDDGGYLDVNAD